MATHRPPQESGRYRTRPLPRANPLVRRCDRVQRWVARVLLALLVVALPAVSVGSGMLVYQSEMRTVHRQSADRRSVTAEAVRDAAEPGVGVSGVDVPVTVRWSGPDGTVRTGRAMVDPGTNAGARVRLWVDRDGEITSAPMTGAKAAAGGWMAGVLAAELAAVGAMAVWRGLVHLMDRRRYAQWEAEWARTEPLWSGRNG